MVPSAPGARLTSTRGRPGKSGRRWLRAAGGAGSAEGSAAELSARRGGKDAEAEGGGRARSTGAASCVADGGRVDGGTVGEGSVGAGSAAEGGVGAGVSGTGAAGNGVDAVASGVRDGACAGSSVTGSAGRARSAARVVSAGGLAGFNIRA